MTESVLTRLLKPLPTPEAWREKLGLSTSGDVSALLGALLTNRGDLAMRGASAVERLPLGAAGRLLASDGTDLTYQTLSAYLDAVFAGEANGDLIGRTAGAWTNRTLAAVLGDMLTDQGMIFRRTASGVEGYQANTNNTLLGGNGSGVASRDATFVRSMINAFDGTYTPTLNNTTNVAASTATLCMYSRVDDFVTVMGYCEIDPTAAAGTATVLGMSIPIASNFTNSLQLAGIALSYATGQMAHIGADSTNDRARWDFLASSNLNTGWRFVFGYTVL